MTNNNYVSTIYNTIDKPFGEYPGKLIRYLIKTQKIKRGSKILEIGCGRGDFINEFIKSQMDGYGVDQSSECKNYFSNILFSKVDLLNENIPLKNNFFDVIFSKSLIEHFYYPEKIMNEAYRLLKPGGIIITLTPDWEFIYKSFYEDYTHRTPFTSVSLKDIHSICNFREIEVKKFKQLPLLWDKSKFYYYPLEILSFLTRILIPEKLRMRNKWIRFSKEIMLLSIAKK